MNKKIIALVLAAMMVLGTFIIGFAAEVKEENADNNSPAKATAFTMSDSVSGVLSAADDVDYYKVTADNDIIANIEFSHNSIENNSVIFTVSVLGADNKTETEFSVRGSEASVKSPAFNMAKGDHYIKIAKGVNWFENNVYKFSVAPVAASNPEVEDNNTSAAATTIKFNSSNESGDYTGAINSGDTDWYKFSAVTGYFKMRFSNIAKGSFAVKAYTISGSNLKNEILNLSVDATQESVQFPSVGTSADTVYISVEGLNGTLGQYAVYVKVFPDTESEAEYNNTKETANNYTFDKEVYASLSSKADVDMYRITTTDETKNYKVVVHPSPTSQKGSVSWNVALLKNDGSTVGEYMASNAVSATIDFSTLDSGTYYLKVSAGSNFGTTDYILSSEKVEKSVATPTDATSFSEFWAGIRAQFRQWWRNNNFNDLMKNVDITTYYYLIKGFIAPLVAYFSKL